MAAEVPATVAAPAAVFGTLFLSVALTPEPVGRTTVCFTSCPPRGSDTTLKLSPLLPATEVDVAGRETTPLLRSGLFLSE